MDTIILPTVGSSGYFQCRAPFDALITPGERYTCEGIRSLSDMLANNETPKVDIYDKYLIDEAVYTQDLDLNMSIVSLQGETGHWLYVPAHYIITYPITNGIPYRTMMIGIALPALPANRDLSFLQTDIVNLVKDSLGVTARTNVTERSRVVLITREKHDAAQAARTAASSGKLTDRARYMATLQELQSATQKIAELERYILDNHVTP